MKQRILSVFGILALVLGLTACAVQEPRLNAEGEIFTSYVPPRTAEVGETFGVDSTNSLTLTRAELVADGETRYLLITYNWSNHSTQARTIDNHIRLTVEQGGVPLTPDLSPVADRKKLVTELPAESTQYEIQQAFVLENDDPVSLFFRGNESTIFIDGFPTGAHPVELTIDLQALDAYDMS